MRAPVPFVAPPMPVVASPVIRDDVALDAIAPATWNALAGQQPFLTHAFLYRAAHDGLRGAAHGLDAALPDGVARATRWSARCRCTRRRTATANTCSTGVGPRPIAGTAAATIRSSLAAIPFTPVPGPRVLAPDAARAPRAARARARSRAARHVFVAARAVSARRPKRAEGRSARHDPARRACSSTGPTRAIATSTISWPRSRTTSARR